MSNNVTMGGGQTVSHLVKRFYTVQIKCGGGCTVGMFFVYNLNIHYTHEAACKSSLPAGAVGRHQYHRDGLLQPAL